jgi:hypothetical protein
MKFEPLHFNAEAAENAEKERIGERQRQDAEEDFSGFFTQSFLCVLCGLCVEMTFTERE